MKHTFKTYLVGGAVRDEMLGLPCKDLDYVVLAPSFDAMRDALLADGCKIFVEKPEFLTIRAKHPTLGCVDFACARTDGIYSDGRRPDSTGIATDIVQDLSRRDFTVGAMARDIETNELIDPFNGQKDLANRVLRAVGNPNDRLMEDKLRAFRALRFSVTKELIIEDSLSFAIKQLPREEFDNVSVERVREELFKMFSYDTYASMHLLFDVYLNLWDVAAEKGVWLKPTLELV